MVLPDAFAYAENVYCSPTLTVTKDCVYGVDDTLWFSITELFLCCKLLVPDKEKLPAELLTIWISPLLTVVVSTSNGGLKTEAVSNPGCGNNWLFIFSFVNINE